MVELRLKSAKSLGFDEEEAGVGELGDVRTGRLREAGDVALDVDEFGEASVGLAVGRGTDEDGGAEVGVESEEGVHEVAVEEREDELEQLTVHGRDRRLVRV